ncbi:uncharacterized protein FIBRA_09593 [Fibroporia radiculosa]|uniref:Uncharacterized protein n=1 Tax=Fibroporia radiculosa TaxID=599839 RepID=J7RI48_9APHY|nr:uncharacterized protein FIBRA_09593 [Fibroporia radiculosa]CCM07247.1 predicted protein [Fibroporia radiculosa]
MASTTILTALLISTWFLLTALLLIITITVFYFKETYKVEVILTRQPTTPTIDQTPEWPAGVQVTSPIELTPTPFTNLLSEFLNEGGFCYPFTPLPNVTHHPFLIPGPSDSSNSDAVVLHQFPGPLEIPHNTSEASTRSYHIAPAQVFPSSSPMNTSSSSNPDSPPAASTDSPNMPPLASDASNNGSIDHAPNLQLLANVSEYITASEGYSSDPQEFVVYSNNVIQQPPNDVTRSWRSIPFDTSTPVQDIDPLERVLPYFPGAYTNFVSTTAAAALHTVELVGNWNTSDKEWEEDTWEYLLTQDDNLLESLWASLQDIRDPGVTDEVDQFRAIDTKIDLLLAAQRSIGAELLCTKEEMSQCQTHLKAANLEERLECHRFSIINLLLVPCPAAFTSVPNVRSTVIFEFAQDIQEARSLSPLSSFPFFGTPTEQLQFTEGRLASLAARGLTRPAKEELFREYIGLVETLWESIRLGDQDQEVAEEVQASNSPTPSSPHQPIPT